MSQVEEFESQTQTQSKEFEIPKLYVVYLLNSISQKNSYYIGSSPNPYRRLRQHNGDLTRGGAYRTKKMGSRPWKMVLFVYGFPSKISALQFEHAWQHSYSTRFIHFMKRVQQTKTGGKGIHIRLANLRLLLESPGFVRMGLKIAFFDRNVFNTWVINKYKIKVPGHILVKVKTQDEFATQNTQLNDLENSFEGGNYDQIQKFMNEEEKHQDDYLESSFNRFEESDSKSCSICETSMSHSDDLKCFCYQKGCDAMYHFDCWSNEMIKEMNAIYEEDLSKDTNDQIMVQPLIPIKGKCIKCDKINFWNTVVRNSLYFGEKLKQEKDT